MKAKTEQNTGFKPQTALEIRTPEANDGRAIHALVKASGALDVNSEYVYLLLGVHFQETCAIAEINGNTAGFVSAYVLPKQQDTLFVWQVAVNASYQKQGLALAMLKHILQRASCQNIRYVQATISPSNLASRSLFMSLAREYGAPLNEQPMFPSDYFHHQHEAEPLITIGPLEYE